LGDAQIREGVEESDDCELQGTGEGVEQKLTVAQFLDTVAPKFTSGNVAVNANGVTGTAGKVTINIPVTDATAITWSVLPDGSRNTIDVNNERSGWSFNPESKEIRWNGNQAVTTYSGIARVTDEAGNNRDAPVSVSIGSTAIEQPENPDPEGGT
jgi:hypothetical protein